MGQGAVRQLQNTPQRLHQRHLPATQTQAGGSQVQVWSYSSRSSTNAFLRDDEPHLRIGGVPATCQLQEGMQYITAAHHVAQLLSHLSCSLGGFEFVAKTTVHKLTREPQTSPAPLGQVWLSSTTRMLYGFTMFTMTLAG